MKLTEITNKLNHYIFVPYSTWYGAARKVTNAATYPVFFSDDEIDRDDRVLIKKLVQKTVLTQPLNLHSLHDTPLDKRNKEVDMERVSAAECEVVYERDKEPHVAIKSVQMSGYRTPEGQRLGVGDIVPLFY